MAYGALDPRCDASYGRRMAWTGLVAWRRIGVATATCACLLAASGGPARAATVDVTTTADESDAGACVANDADCSLREAIVAADANADADTIRIPAGTYPIASGPDPNPPTPDATTGDFDVSHDLTIERSGSGLVTIDGDTNDRVFDLQPQTTVTISDVTIVNGQGELGPDDGLSGGGIRAFGDLTLNRVVMQHNHARASGGAVSVKAGGALHVHASTFSENEAPSGTGGAIDVESEVKQVGPSSYTPVSASATLEGSVVSGNSAANGAGIGVSGAGLQVG